MCRCFSSLRRKAWRRTLTRGCCDVRSRSRWTSRRRSSSTPRCSWSAPEAAAAPSRVRTTTNTSAAMNYRTSINTHRHHPRRRRFTPTPVIQTLRRRSPPSRCATSIASRITPPPRRRRRKINTATAPHLSSRTSRSIAHRVMTLMMSPSWKWRLYSDSFLCGAVWRHLRHAFMLVQISNVVQVFPFVWRS